VFDPVPPLFTGKIPVTSLVRFTNANAVATDTSCIPPSVTQLRIGNAVQGSSLMSGHIRCIAYYPKRLSTSELQALTV
jgi:hypothetical protein